MRVHHHEGHEYSLRYLLHIMNVSLRQKEAERGGHLPNELCLARDSSDTGPEINTHEHESPRMEVRQ